MAVSYNVEDNTIVVEGDLTTASEEELEMFAAVIVRASANNVPVIYRTRTNGITKEYKIVYMTPEGKSKVDHSIIKGLLKERYEKFQDIYTIAFTISSYRYG